MSAPRICTVLTLAAAALTLAPAPSPAPPAHAARIDQLLTGWQKRAGKTQSLVVEFNVSQWDPVLRKNREFAGVLKLLKKPGVPLQGYYEWRPKGKPVEFRVWLGGERLSCCISSEDKTLRTLPPVKQQNTFDFLVRWLNPLILCLDKQRAQREYRIRVTKQDEWYTYLAVVPQAREYQAQFESGRLAILNKPTADIPADFPVRFVLVRPNGSIDTFDILRWRLDDTKAWRAEDFKPPAGPDWKVIDWPANQLKSP